MPSPKYFICVGYFLRLGKDVLSKCLFGGHFIADGVFESGSQLDPGELTASSREIKDCGLLQRRGVTAG